MALDTAEEGDRCPSSYDASLKRRSDGPGSEVAEAALAHVVKNKVEAAYARSDLLDRRREVMEAWAAYLVGERRSAEADPVC